MLINLVWHANRSQLSFENLCFLNIKVDLVNVLGGSTSAHILWPMFLINKHIDPEVFGVVMSGGGVRVYVNVTNAVFSIIGSFLDRER